MFIDMPSERPAIIRPHQVELKRGIMPFLTPFFGKGVAVATGPQRTKTDAKVDATNTTSYSFSSVNLGTPAADRYIVVAISVTSSGGAAQSIGAVTVAGNATTKLINKRATGASPASDTAIFITNAVDASNSTGTIVVPVGAPGGVNCGIVVYAVTGLTSNAADGTPQTTNTSGATMSLPISASGLAFGSVVTTGGSAGNFTWSGLTEDTDQLMETANGMQGAASAASATAQTLSVICTATNASDFAACCVALK